MREEANSIIVDAAFKAFDTILRIIAATSYLLISVGFCTILYLWLTPMSWWGVTYTAIDIVPPDRSDGEELIRIHRFVDPAWGVVPIERLTEILTETPLGKRQWCLTTTQTSATSMSNPMIISGLDEYVSDRCVRMAFPRLEGQKIWLLITYQRKIPLGFVKLKALSIGPYVIRDGIIRQTLETSDDEAIPLG